jgi:hypothetical protein
MLRICWQKSEIVMARKVSFRNLIANILNFKKPVCATHFYETENCFAKRITF